jgi:hypothetical protein
MNKMKYLLTLLLTLGGCTTTTKNIKTAETIDLTKTTPIYYQAYDEKWYSDPSINPIFDNEWEAKEYAKRNSMSELSNAWSGHDYIVRVINHRYEVRQVNDEVGDILHITDEFNDAYEYVVEYSSAHSDLVIFDLKTGKSHEETP